jgi:hypothetical protein
VRIEYTNPTPSTRLQRVDGRQPIRRRPTEQTAGSAIVHRSTIGRPGAWSGEQDFDRMSSYERAQRRYQLAAERRSHPDTGVHGTAVPYNRPLPGGRGDWLWFDGDTRWLHDIVVPVSLEHGGSFLGTATPISERSGLVIDGTVYNGFAKRIGDRRQLSVKVDQLDLAPRPDGTLHVRQVRLREVSLCRTAMWRPLTEAVLWQRPAA